MRKSLTRIVVICLLVFLLVGTTSFGRTEDPTINSEGALLMNLHSGKALYGKNIDMPLEPASLTKILTALIVLEDLGVNDQVTVTAEAAQVGEATMDLKGGEVLTIGNLVTGMLVVSANDAAVALAIAHSGSVEAFAQVMNQRATDLGATSSNFTNPNGLAVDATHVTTVNDLGLITKKAMENEFFRETVGQKTCSISATNLSGPREYKSTNALLSDEKGEITVGGETRPILYSGVTGVKTGTTDTAGYCLVASASKSGMEIVSITLKAGSNENRYEDAISLLDFGFENFYTVNLMKKGASCGQVSVQYGTITKANTSVSEDINVTLPIEGMESLAETKIVLDEKVKAPIKKGTKVGVVEIYEGPDKIGEADVIIDETVKKGGPWTRFYISDMMATIFFIALGTVILLVIVILLFRSNQKRKLERKRKEKRERKALEIAQEREEKKKRDWPY